LATTVVLNFASTEEIICIRFVNFQENHGFEQAEH